MKRFTNSRWHRVVLAVSAFAVTAGLASAACFARQTHRAIHNSYAVWQVADLVIAYMEAHDGAWPRSWEDLKPIIETGSLPSVPANSFEELQKRVEIDWNAEPKKLVEMPVNSEGPPFNLIWLKSESPIHWEGREPNRMILDYLREKRRVAKSKCQPEPRP